MRRIGILFLCLLSLGVGAVGFVSLISSPDFGLELELRDGAWTAASVEQGGPADRAGMRVGDTLISLGGRSLNQYSLIHDFDMIPDFRNLADFWNLQRDLGATVRPGSWVELGLGPPCAGRTLRLQPRTLSPGRVIRTTMPLYIPALYCLAVGLAVALKRRRDDRAHLFFTMLFTVSLIFFTFGSWSSRNLVAAPALMYNLAVFNLAYAFPFFPVIFLHFCLAFPVKAKILSKKWFLPLLYILPVLIMAVYIPRIVFEVYQLYWAGGLVGGAAVMLVRYFKQKVPLYRAQIKWILWGTVLFGIGMFLTYSIPLLLRSYGYYSYLLPSFSFLLIPTAFALAILRYRLLDIEELFDSTFAHTLATGFFIGLDILLSFGARRLLGEGLIENETLASALALVLVIMFYVPMRERLGILIKRLFKREYYKADKVALDLASGLLSSPDEASAKAVFESSLGSTLHPRWVRWLEPTAVPGGIPLDPAMESRALALAEGLEKPQDLDSLLSPEEAPPRLSGSAILPLRARGSRLAALVLGPKVSGNIYTRGDLRLLEVFCGQTALALDDLAERRKALAAEVDRREEDQRLSREIHDGVGGMLGNSIMLAELLLTEGLAEQARTRVSAIHTLVRQSLGELRTMIWALHDEEGSCASLAAAMEERLGQMTAGQGIEFRFEKDLPHDETISASLRLHMLRASQELVANGVKHASAHGIRVALRQIGADLILEYEDDGKGCDLSLASKGYGLANLDKRARSMGGSLSLESEPGKGFRASLRVRAAA